MPIEQLTPPEAQAAMEETEGSVYLDVRTVGEHETGHPEVHSMYRLPRDRNLLSAPKARHEASGPESARRAGLRPPLVNPNQKNSCLSGMRTIGTSSQCGEAFFKVLPQGQGMAWYRI